MGGVHAAPLRSISERLATGWLADRSFEASFRLVPHAPCHQSRRVQPWELSTRRCPRLISSPIISYRPCGGGRLSSPSLSTRLLTVHAMVEAEVEGLCRLGTDGNVVSAGDSSRPLVALGNVVSNVGSGARASHCGGGHARRCLTCKAACCDDCERLLMASARALGPGWSCVCRWQCRYCVGSKGRHARER